MKSILTIGALQLTPYSLFIFAGALTGTLLAARKKATRPALPFVIGLAVIGGHLIWCLMNDTSMEYYGTALLYQFWRGGYTLYGALLGGALGAWIGGRLSGTGFTEVTDGLAPGAAAMVFFARMGEYFSGQGMGPSLENEELFFFPLAYVPYGEAAEGATWYYAVWFWEAIAALILLAVLLTRRNNRRGDLTYLFVSILGITQIFFEQIRRDDYVSLTGFVRFSQVGAMVSVIAVLIAALIRGKARAGRWIFSFATLAAAAVTVMYVEFALDKSRYYPILYLSTAITAGITAAFLAVTRGRSGWLSAGLFALFGGILIFSHALEDPEAGAYVILYGFMAWALSGMGAVMAVSIHESRNRGNL